MSGQPIKFIPEIWQWELAKQQAVSSVLANFRDPYARRGHYWYPPNWLVRLGVRSRWVYDESEAEYQARLSALPPRPLTVTFPIIGGES